MSNDDSLTASTGTRAADTESPDDRGGGSADRTLRLLALLADEGRPLTLADLTHRLALPKATVHRLCSNLVASGHLMRDTDERLFTVGPALRQLAFNTLNHASLSGQRHSVLKALVRDIGETCNFTTLDGAEVLYLDRVEARRPLRLTIDVGEHVPLHCTASGKLFLAHMPRRQRDAMISRLPLTALTPTSITTVAALKAECDEIVASGFARDREEFVPGLIAIAVPVRDSEGTVRATVSVHAPAARMSMADAEARIDRLAAAAREMAELL
jgi:DNA-binding IclR family transcriptional regulator